MTFLEFVEILFKKTGFKLTEERAIIRKVFEPYKDFVFIASRGTGKSMSEAAKIVARMIRYKSFKQLYVTPSEIQTQTFVRHNVDPLIINSIARRYFVNAQKMEQVKNKIMTNGSTTAFRHAEDDMSVKRIRGLHVDALILDEVQDMLPEVRDILLPVLDNSEFGIAEYLGTFKTMSHFSYFLWEQSDQHEYGIKCEHCGNWNLPLDQDNIGKHGLICKKCGKDINRFGGAWIRMNPQKPGGEPNNIFGIRFSHLFVPFMKWESILRARESMQWDKFLNEIVGLPTDVLDVPITEMELIKATQPSIKNALDKPPKHVLNLYPTVGGLDWQGDHSTTVAAVIAITPLGPIVYAMKRFVGPEAANDVIVNNVIKFFSKWKVRLLFADYGMGAGRNIYLRKHFTDQHFAEVQYSGTASAKIRWNNQAKRYIVNRTACMDDVFVALKNNKLQLFRWEDFQEFKEDVLCIFKDVNERSKYIYYDHSPSKNDDAFHAIVLAYLAYIKFAGEEFNPRYNIKTQEKDISKKEYKQSLLRKRSGNIITD